MRIIACQALGIECAADVARLSAMQCADGGWPPCVIYKFASKGLGITNRGLSTALAVKAIGHVSTNSTARVDVADAGAGGRRSRVGAVVRTNGTGTHSARSRGQLLPTSSRGVREWDSFLVRLLPALLGVAALVVFRVI